MMNYKDIPIRRKLMGAIMFITSVVLLVMCGVYMLFEYSSYKSTLKGNVAALGAVIATNSSAALAFQSSADAAEILSALKANKSIVAACLYDADGRLFAGYPVGLAAKDFPATPQKDGYRFEGDYLVGFQPVFEK